MPIGCNLYYIWIYFTPLWVVPRVYEVDARPPSFSRYRLVKGISRVALVSAFFYFRVFAFKLFFYFHFSKSLLLSFKISNRATPAKIYRRNRSRFGIINGFSHLIYFTRGNSTKGIDGFSCFVITPFFLLPFSSMSLTTNLTFTPSKFFVSALIT